jgi:hypothetical protein
MRRGGVERILAGVDGDLCGRRTRDASLDVPFGSMTPIHELDSADGEYPSWISPDRCRLYLTRRVNGHWDLFVASRAP